MSNQKDEKAKVIALVIIVVFIIFIIVNASTDNKGKNPAPAPSPQQTAVNNASSAFKLASLEIGHNSPDPILVNQFEAILTRLGKKCPNETEEQIAGYVFVGKTQAKKYGVSQTLMQIANGIDQSIPPEAVGTVRCDEIAAAYVTLLGQ